MSAYREVWTDALAPGGFVCSICGCPVESEPCPDHAQQPATGPRDSGEERLLRYARAIADEPSAAAGAVVYARVARAVMAVADEELAAQAESERDRLAAALAQVRAEADWLFAHHDGSLVTSDYPMIGRRLLAVLDAASEVGDERSGS